MCTTKVSPTLATMSPLEAISMPELSMATWPRGSVSTAKISPAGAATARCTSSRSGMRRLSHPSFGGAAGPVGIRHQFGVRAGEGAGGGGVAAQPVFEPRGGIAQFAAGVPAVRGVHDRVVVCGLAARIADDAKRGVHGGAVVEGPFCGRARDERVERPIGGAEEDGLGQRGGGGRALSRGRAAGLAPGPARA